MVFELQREGHRSWEVSQDEQGFRTYKIVHRIKGSTRDGPANALQCPGLPVAGSLWVVDDDVDVFAWFRLEATAKPASDYKDGEPAEYWDVEQLASSKPQNPDKSRCNQSRSEDPILQPPEHRPDQAGELRPLQGSPRGEHPGGPRRQGGPGRPPVVGLPLRLDQPRQ
jgi:hypothetical protein